MFYHNVVGCNVFKYGEQYKYSLYLGNKLSKKLLIESRNIIKFTNAELEDMIKEYTERFNKLV